MRKIIIISAIALLAATSLAFARAPQQTMFPEVGTALVKKMMDDGTNFVLVDTRTADEYAKGHIKGAISVPPEKFQFIAGLLPKDKDVPVILYCRGYG